MECECASYHACVQYTEEQLLTLYQDLGSIRALACHLGWSRDDASKAIRAINPSKPRRLMTPAMATALYRELGTVTAVSKATGVGHVTVRNRLRDADVQIRARENNEYRNTFNPQLAQQVREIYARTGSVKAVARKLSISRSTAYRWMRWTDVPLLKPGRRRV